MPTFKTDIEIKRLVPKDGDRRTDYQDAIVSRLWLRVSAATRSKPVRRNFTYFGRDENGELRRIGIGPHPQVTLAAARLLASQYMDGTKKLPPKKDGPATTAVAAVLAAPKTVADLIEKFNAYRDDKIEAATRSDVPLPRNRRLRPGTVKIERLAFKNHIIPIWGERDYRDIKRHDVTDLAKAVRLGETRRYNPANSRVRGGVMASHNVLVSLTLLFGWAVKQEYISADPTRFAEFPMKRTRKRVLSEDEIRIVWRAACQKGYPVGTIYLMGLITGQRISEIAGIEWANLEPFDDCTWRQSFKQTKTWSDHALPLPALAMELLRSIPHPAGCRYVFSFDNGVNYCHVGGSQAWKMEIDQIIEANNVKPLEPWVFHDLRRTFSTKLRDLDEPEATIERLLNHVVKVVGVDGGDRERLSNSAAVYDRHDYMKKKRATMNVWDAFLRELNEPMPDFKLKRECDAVSRNERIRLARASAQAEGRPMPGQKRKIPPYLRAEIVRLHLREGKSLSQLATQFGCSTTTVHDTIKREIDAAVAAELITP